MSLSLMSDSSVPFTVDGSSLLFDCLNRRFAGEAAAADAFNFDGDEGALGLSASLLSPGSEGILGSELLADDPALREPRLGVALARPFPPISYAQMHTPA